ncbi:unnamed protein product [Caenorhabditis bovis]|uniref:Tyrosine-protein phosphatase domain-containing protein n=1 Tax=Caenorhabditis bovis TaxID=2654633 RepID=A0A8S1F888_9PELO|nr:unnamed protein product [Caenorhabditis bovis]
MSRNAKSGNKSKMGEATMKRRKLSAMSNKGSPATNDGDTPEELIAHFTTIPNKKNLYDALSGHARIVADGFLKNIDKNIRLPVPIPEKRRVKLDKDEDYIPAQYVKLENSEYVLVQAPSKANQRELWRLVWQDQIKVMICLCTEEQMSASDDAKCFPYFPNEANQTKEIETKKGKLVVTCKAKESTSCMYHKYELEVTMTEAEGTSEEKKPDEELSGSVAGKVLPITLFHMYGWPQKPENSKDPFDMSHNVALLCKEVFKAEMNVLRKSMENFVPPVLIQSMDAIGRSAVLWVCLMLYKDVEKRECFDVPELIKKVQKMRPGSLSTYHSFCFTFAVSLWIGKEANWMSDSECSSKLGELTKGYLDRKLNEQGVPII